MTSLPFQRITALFTLLVFLVVCYLSAVSFAQTCTQYPDPCLDNTDCCTSLCSGNGTCEEGCTLNGFQCVNDTECCSDVCKSDMTCEEGCTVGLYHCTDKAECCSYNCHDNVCQPGEDRCTFPGGQCNHDVECCEGTRCWDNGLCNKAMPRATPHSLLAYSTCILAALVFVGG